MPPRDDRRDRRDRDEEEKPVKPAGRPLWVYYVGGGALFLVLVIVTALVGAWHGARSVPWPREEEESLEEEAIEAALVERLRLVRGLDLARERPPLRLGERDRLMALSPRLSIPGRVTDGVLVETLEPEERGELVRPLRLRPSDPATLERGVADVSESLTVAGNLGRAETVRPPLSSARAADSPETPSPEIQTPDARPPDERPMEAFSGSTFVPPPGYNESVSSP